MLSVRDATVYHINYTALNGIYMRLRCDEGYHIVYAHLNEVAVNIGDQVAQGQIVAFSGNTGQSTGPHLHYGLSRGGQRLDPFYRVANLQKSPAALRDYANR